MALDISSHTKQHASDGTRRVVSVYHVSRGAEATAVYSHDNGIFITSHRDKFTNKDEGSVVILKVAGLCPCTYYKCDDVLWRRVK